MHFFKSWTSLQKQTFFRDFHKINFLRNFCGLAGGVLYSAMKSIEQYWKSLFLGCSIYAMSCFLSSSVWAGYFIWESTSSASSLQGNIPSMGAAILYITLAICHLAIVSKSSITNGMTTVLF